MYVQQTLVQVFKSLLDQNPGSQPEFRWTGTVHWISYSKQQAQTLVHAGAKLQICRFGPEWPKSKILVWLRPALSIHISRPPSCCYCSRLSAGTQEQQTLVQVFNSWLPYLTKILDPHLILLEMVGSLHPAVRLLMLRSPCCYCKHSRPWFWSPWCCSAACNQVKMAKHMCPTKHCLHGFCFRVFVLFFFLAQ